MKQARAASSPIVFVASTCYDLMDLRAELKEWLEKDDFIVRLSEDWDSDFRVDPSKNSIESCLDNLRGSDVVVLILDRRYGPPLGGTYGDKSATHVEFDTAKDTGINILTLVRKHTMVEFEQWRMNEDSFSRKWADSRLFTLIEEIRNLHNKEERSNWIDQFDSSADIRRIAAKRLYDVFPSRENWRAKTRDRIVILQFADCTRGSPDPFKVYFCLENVGLNLALDVRAYAVLDGEKCSEPKGRFALPVGKKTDTYDIELDSRPGCRELVCEYCNPWGDRYEIRAPLRTGGPGTASHIGSTQKFSVLEMED